MSVCGLFLGKNVLKVLLRKFFKIGNYISFDLVFSLKEAFVPQVYPEMTILILIPQYSPHLKITTQICNCVISEPTSPHF
jgi:hypothetical protein